MNAVSSWGRLASDPHFTLSLRHSSDVKDMLQRGTLPGLAYGMGRSYGDVCLNPGGMLWMAAELDRFIAFDESNGQLICEAGVLLRDIQRLLLPRGWMLPVTPGTQLVTVGGSIANDVHGKNHHRFGSFGDYVLGLSLVRTDGVCIDCGPDKQPDWFRATVGGLGLTGVIIRATIQLRRVHGPWLDTETIPYGNLDDFFSIASESEGAWEHTVSWIDCHARGGGRGLFMRGNPIDSGTRYEPKRARVTVPFVPPFSLINRGSLQLFNAAYYHLKKSSGRRIAHYEAFHYPLDNVLEWNRIYGPKGFFQYQCVVPIAEGRIVIQSMLNEISRGGDGSFLAVLKAFGNRKSMGMLGFPRPGVTLALDFPNCGQRTLDLLGRLDVLVREAGGCLYPAKDARMPREMFEFGYPELKHFLSYRDPGISSGFSRRLMGS